MRNINIKIVNKKDPIRIPAEVIGDWGYHKIIEEEEYTVTHINSGLRIELTLQKEEAKELTNFLVNKCRMKWNGNDKDRIKFKTYINILIERFKNENRDKK